MLRTKPQLIQHVNWELIEDNKQFMRQVLEINEFISITFSNDPIIGPIISEVELEIEAERKANPLQFLIGKKS